MVETVNVSSLISCRVPTSHQRPSSTDPSPFFPLLTKILSMAPEYNPFENDRIQFDSIQEWECARCAKTIPTSPAPLLSPDACICVDSDPFVRDHRRPQEVGGFGQDGYRYQPPRTDHHFQAQSYASSSVSAPCPEGPERDDPNTNATNGFLHVEADPGLDETQFRPCSSDPFGLSLQMWRFLVEQDYNRPGYAAEPAGPDPRFLVQEALIRPHLRGRGSSNKGRKASHQSILSSCSDEPSFAGCDGDPMAGVGSWDDTGAYVYSSDEYPLTMSGLVECPAEG